MRKDLISLDINWHIHCSSIVLIMKKLFLPIILLSISTTLVSCGDSGGLSKLGGGESTSTTVRQYSISAPAEVIVGEPYSISLVDSAGKIATAATRLVIARGSTVVYDDQRQDLALYSHTADTASVGQILIYTMYYNGAQYSAGSLVKAPEPEDDQQ